MLDLDKLLAPLSPEQPCGEDLAFSPEYDAINRARQADDPSIEQGAWVTALKEAGATDLYTVNVLEEPEIRANLPRFSNWPSFPQLFIHGELIGGCDITLELHESGELQRILSEALSQ